VATGLGFIGTAASGAGNEGAICFGRKRLIAMATLASILIGGTLGFLGSTSYALAAVLMIEALDPWSPLVSYVLYGIVISSSFTGTAEPSRRGAMDFINWSSTALQLFDCTPDRPSPDI